jgi:hypothetical protein
VQYDNVDVLDDSVKRTRPAAINNENLLDQSVPGGILQSNTIQCKEEMLESESVSV